MKQLFFILILFCSIQGFGQKIVGYWRLNGDATDASGNDLNGTETNVSYVPGPLNKCAYIDGKNGSKITFNYINSLPVGSSVRTISCMVNIIETGTSNYGFFFRYGDNTVTGRQIALHYLPPGIIVADFQNVNMYGSSSIALNKWVHVAFVVTGSGYVNQCYLLINGALYCQGSSTTQLNTQQSSTKYPIFGWNIANSYAFKGKMAEVKADYSAMSFGKIKNEFARIKGFF